MAAKTKPVAPPGRPLRVSIDSLWLDPENPRLPEANKKRSQDELISLLADDYSLTEIGQSLADNGFFSEEPLAVVRSKDGTDQYTVIEGNRRLAALKLLTDSALRSRLNLREWDDLARKSIYELKTIPVIAYHDRRELVSFMGFRHITGVKPWEPLAKARFLYRLLTGGDLDFQEAARRVGSKTNAIRHHYLTYCVYVQARDEFEVSVSGVEKAFGVFTRALSSSPLRQHIGISSTKEQSTSPQSLRSPVPKSKGDNLRELISWIAGNGQPPVITDSRQITSLGEVVAAPEALKLLRASRNLELARQLTGGEEARLLENLSRASYHLDEALRDAHRHRRSKRVESAIRRCEETVGQLLRTLAI